MTSRLDLPRGLTSVAIMVALGGEYGASPESLLRGSGIDPAMLDRPMTETTGAAELVVVRNLLHECARIPALGLQAGLRYRITTHGVLGFLILSSPTAGEALRAMVQYFDLTYSYSRVSAEYGPDEVSIIFDDSGAPPDVRRFLLERDLAALHASATSVVADLEPTRVELMMSAPPYAELYEAFNVIPVFDRPRNLAVIPREVLARPMQQGDANAAAIAERQCIELLNSRRERVGTSGAVRDVLLRTRRFTADQDDVADALAMSVRTLRRRLTDEGTSYREIVAETAGLLAEEMLTTGLTVEDVAHRLGYTGAPAFTVAFKKWKGVTPGAFARERRVHR